MNREVSDGVPSGSTRAHCRSISEDDARHGCFRDAPDRSAQESDSSVLPIVVLFEQHDGVFSRLKDCFTMAGFGVTRARNSAEAVKRFVSESSDLLVVNADVSAESVWGLVAKLRLTHPVARIWVYIRQVKTHDLAAANLLAIEELIEYQGEVAQLETQVLDRLDMSPPRGPRNSGLSNSIQFEPIAATASASAIRNLT